VLICQECGNKRSQEEAFLCLSLPLEKAGGKKLTVERCLYDFTLPESLSDPVQCPSCGRKTPTQKQHVLCKLPKVLILHLKRFDAMRNRKIEDLVDFEAVLNMGFYLPHWSEVTRLEQRDGDDPVILYDLFATSNHYGTLESGHYVANVKVEDSWYLINDAHVAFVAEADVLRNQSAYMLFYIRR
jgi:ubiquitin C-terminal hydrolase